MQSLHKIKNLNLAWTGASLESGPQPAFFYFALTAAESLNLEPYCQPVRFLKNAPIRCFSLTLPYHTEGLNPAQTMKLWIQGILNGEDLLSPLLMNCSSAVDALIEQKVIDPLHIYAGGISRGAYVALQLAARDPRFKGVLGFAPLTSLDSLDELKEYHQESVAPKLINTHVRLYVGNRDERVNTDNVYKFIRDLTEAKYQSGERSPNAELIITPSIGHKGHGTSTPTFKDGSLWILNRINTRNI